MAGKGKYHRVSFDTRYSEDFLDLIDYVRKVGGYGHSFDIVVDPDNKDYKKSFGFDGDGSDFIKKLSIKEIDENEWEEKITEAKDFSASYDDRTRKVKVLDHGKIRFFRDISPDEFMRLNNGLTHNPKSGYLHFQAFLSRNFDKEIGGEYDQAYAEYKRQKSEEDYEKDLKSRKYDEDDE